MNSLKVRTSQDWLLLQINNLIRMKRGWKTTLFLSILPILSFLKIGRIIEIEDEPWITLNDTVDWSKFRLGMN